MLLLVLIKLITAESFIPFPNQKYEKFSQKALFISIPFPTLTAEIFLWKSNENKLRGHEVNKLWKTSSSFQLPFYSKQ